MKRKFTKRPILSSTATLVRITNIADCRKYDVPSAAYLIFERLIDADRDWELNSKERTVNAVIDAICDPDFMKKRDYEFYVDPEFGETSEFYDFIDREIPEGDYDAMDEFYW